MKYLLSMTNPYKLDATVKTQRELCHLAELVKFMHPNQNMTAYKISKGYPYSLPGRFYFGKGKVKVLF